MEINVDLIIDTAGKSGKYQFLLNLILYFSSLLMYAFIICFPFFEIQPQVDYQDLNGNFYTDTKLTYEVCENSKNIILISSTQWSWLTILQINCDKLKISIFNISFYFGLLFGSLILKYLCNSVGRKTTFLIFAVLLNVTRLCYNFPLYYYSLILLNFIAGTSELAGLFSCNMLCMENADYKSRTLIQCVQYSLGSLAIILILLYLKLTNDWLTCLNIMSALNTLLIIAAIFILHESPLFYLYKKNLDLFFETLGKISKVNNTFIAFDSLILQNYYHIKSNYLEETDSNEESLFVKDPEFYVEKKKEYYDIIKQLYMDSKIVTSADSNWVLGELFSNKTILIRFLMICYLWFYRSLLYTASNLKVKSLAGDIYLTGIIFSISEICQGVVIYFMMNTKMFGRSTTMLILIVLCAIVSGASMFIDSKSIWITVLTFFIRLYTQGLSLITIVYSVEAYPTNSRGAGVSLNSGAARLGMMLSSFLVEYMGNSIIYVFFGMSVLAVIPYFFILETYESSISK